MPSLASCKLARTSEKRRHLPTEQLQNINLNMPIIGLISQQGASVAEAKQLTGRGITVVGFDYEPSGRQQLMAAGVVVTSSVRAVLLHLPAEKIIWAVVGEADKKAALMQQLSENLPHGSVVVDGSGGGDAGFWTARFEERKIHFLFIENGGKGLGKVLKGKKEIVEKCRPIFDWLG